ncbi:hypothetical protein B0J14DRAFT_580690 [Halenospora varia]|nr:hypothetical protein B0J14DRAFT_580690 [Halenospora varia]
MTGSPFEFQTGAIYLGGENDESMDRSSTVTVRAPMPTSSLVSHGLSVCFSVLGISSLLWTSFIGPRDSALQIFPGGFAVIAVLLSASLFWPILVLLALLPKALLDLSTAKNTVSAICLTYFSSTGLYYTSLFWTSQLCDYLTLCGLICAGIVAFLQALQLFSPTRRLVVQLRSESRLGQYCIKMLESNESTKIVLCHISAILSSTSLCLTVWSYVIGASGEKQLEEGTSCDVLRFDGVGILAILLTISSIWFIANSLAIVISHKKPSNPMTRTSEFTLALTMIGVAVYSFIVLNSSHGPTATGGECSPLSGKGKAHYLVAIVLTFIIGVTHTSVFLNRIRPRLLSFRDRTLLWRLNGPHGMKFLQSRSWTDDEIISILNMKGLTERARDNIVSLLYQINSEGAPIANTSHSTAPSSKTRPQEMSNERNWRDEQLISIYDVPQRYTDDDVELGLDDHGL